MLIGLVAGLGLFWLLIIGLHKMDKPAPDVPVEPDLTPRPRFTGQGFYATWKEEHQKVLAELAERNKT